MIKAPFSNRHGPVPWSQDDPSGLLALTGVVPLIAIVVGAWAPICRA